jgi:uncharacterized membrane protein YhaH (DUF805 family)
MSYPPPTTGYAQPTPSGSPLAPQKVGFSEAIKLYYSNYANFSGRASRSEYWFVSLYSAIVAVPLYILAFSSGSIDPYTGVAQPNGMWMGLIGLWFLVNFIPSLSVLWRRLHDVNKSGGYYFIALIPLVGAILVLIALCTEGDAQQNRFGPAS